MSRKKQPTEMYKFLSNSERNAKNTYCYISHAAASYVYRLYNSTIVKASGLGPRATNYPGKHYATTLQRIKGGPVPFAEPENPIPLEVIAENATSLVDRIDIEKSKLKLEPWSRIDDPCIKLALSHAALIRHGLYKPFTLHLSQRENSKALNHERGVVDYLRRRFRDCFRDDKSLGDFTPEMFWVVELTNKRSARTGVMLLHIHGAITVPSQREGDLKKLRSILRKAGGLDYPQGGNYDQVKFSSTYDFLPGRDKDDNGEMGWVGYSVEEQGNKPGIFRGKDYYISNKLNSSAKALYDAYRDRLSEPTPDREILEAVAELYDWALENARERLMAPLQKLISTYPVGKAPWALYNQCADAKSYIPQDEELFREIVALACLEGLEEVRLAMSNNRDILRAVALRLNDAAHCRRGKRQLRKIRRWTGKAPSTPVRQTTAA